MQIKIHHDAETRGVVPLDKEGADAYFDDPQTDCTMFSHSIEIDGQVFPVESVSRFYPRRESFFTCPPVIRRAVEEGALLYAHNASFERKLWQKLLAPKYGWPHPKDNQFRCTMAMCAAMGLPLALDLAAQALNMRYQKAPQDHQNMMRMCKPRAPRKGEALDRIYWFEEPHRWPKLQERCEQDVRQEMELCELVRELTPEELLIYQLDQRINDRGIYIDKDLAETAAAMIRQITLATNEEMREVTGGKVSAATAVAALQEWVEGECDIELDNLQADTLADLLTKALPAHVHRALELRQSGSKISTRKVNAFLAAVQKDGRTRGWAQYHGAMPGRWSARRIQLHNIKRPTLPKEAVPIAIDTVRKGDIKWCTAMFGEPMELISNILRGCIVAAPGHRLISSDYSNIQGRLGAWYAGQQDKLDAFAAYDAGTGPDLYNVAYASTFNIPIGDVGPFERQIGKVIELSMTFEGGPAAFDQMAATANPRLIIEDHYDHIMASIGHGPGLNGDYSIAEETERAWNSYGFKSEMLPRKWFASEMIKRAWRRRYSKITAFWAVLKQAAIEAVYTPTQTAWAGDKIAYRMHGGHLACRLPDGKVIWYLYPELREVELPWSTPEKPAYDVSLTYMRKNPMTHQWERTTTHGGKQMENICLGAERQLLAQAMIRAEARGYPIVLHVHDEAVAELPHGQGSLAEFNAILMDVEPWIAGCPIASAGWEGHEYRKG